MMKIRLNTPVKRTSFYAGILFLSVSLTNCSSDDDNTPEDFNFEQEFDNIGEMPALDIEELTFDPVDLGGVQQSESTSALLADFSAGGELSAESQAKVNSLASFSNGLSAEVQAEAANLDESRIDEILAMTTFDGDLATLVAALENAPDEIKALLPSINFSTDFDAVAAVLRTPINLDGKDLYSQSSEEGPCYDAANNAYDAAMEEPAAALADQIEQITIYEADKTADANTFNEEQGDNVSDGAATYLGEIKTTALSILDLANATEDADLATTLRSFALFYAVQGRMAVTEWQTKAEELVAFRLNANLERITAQILSLEDRVNGNFDQIKTRALQVLNTALSTCHNQGGGNS